MTIRTDSFLTLRASQRSYHLAENGLHIKNKNSKHDGTDETAEVWVNSQPEIGMQ